MKKYLTAVLIFCFLLQACKDTRDKAQDFVEEYNAAASRISTRDLQSTIAELQPDNTIHIVLVSGIQKSEANTAMFDVVMPSVIADMLGKMPSFQELIDEGVKFHVEYRAVDNSVLAETTVDRLSLKKVGGKASGNPAVPELSKKKVHELLSAVKESLPIADQESGTRIINVNLKDSDLLIDIEVSDEFRASFKEDDTFVAGVKKRLLRDDRIRSILSIAREYGVKRVVCEYTTLQKVTIGKIVIDEREFSAIK